LTQASSQTGLHGLADQLPGHLQEPVGQAVNVGWSLTFDLHVNVEVVVV
jgi:hypothetical protein